MDKQDKIIIFDSKDIRRTWFNDEWYYSLVDIIKVLTDSIDAKDYWYRLKKRELIQGIDLSTYCRQLKLESSDGKKYKTDCANTKNVFRLIQSIPSKKVEPFKQWLAQLGQDRLDEIENPELAVERTREYYRKKGYPKEWIEKRVESINVRQKLTDEWNEREILENKEYAILTNEIHKATFGLPIKEHKKIKSLTKKNQNLRDNMNSLELIFSMLGEEPTLHITKTQNSIGFGECLDSAQKGGEIAGNARLELEKESGNKIIKK